MGLLGGGLLFRGFVSRLVVSKDVTLDLLV